ncbi:MAG: thiol-disulfide oxidoreductase DCC family protein, partial [Verrucomicrobiota bacterium]
MARNPVDPALHGTTGAILVLFDGTCGLCDGFVRFVIERDPDGRFQFATLQGETGRRACTAAGLTQPGGAGPDTVVVLEDGVARVRSDAVLAIATRLPFPWPILTVGRWVPRPLRDALYRGVARHRHRWFGRPSVCPVPDPG